MHNEINLTCYNIHNTCNIPFKGIVAYNGNYFHNLDIGVQTHDWINENANGIPDACITYNNKTLYGGSFASAGSNTLFSVGAALWNGSVWDTFPKRTFTYNSNLSPNVSGFLLDNGKLWIGGVFNTLGGVSGKNLYTFDGSNYSVVNLPANYDNIGVRQILKYKSDIYITGLFKNNVTNNYEKILKYNGSIWLSIGNGVLGGLATIQNIIVYNDTLFVGGAFSKTDGNLGNHIMKWDGIQFLDAGFGGFYDWGAVTQMLIHKNRLYAFGNYSHVADKKAFGKAYYEKGKWVIDKDSLYGGLVGGVVFKDTIYVAGGFLSINGDTSLKMFVKLKCPDFNCNPIGIAEKKKSVLEVKLFPNPANTEINLSLNNEFHNLIYIQVYNCLGQIIYDEIITENKLKINCDIWPKGLYFFKIQESNTNISIKILIEH